MTTATPADLVLYEPTPPAVTLRLNRPDRRNALSRDLISALTSAVERAGADPAVRVVVLTGAGPAFCAGMDLAELQESLRETAEETTVWADAVRLSALYELIYRLPKPTVAAVNGAAVAGGAGLASVCDLAVAADGAVFGYPEVRRGLVAAMVMPHLLRLVGERTARSLLLTGEVIGAAQALRVGLVNSVVPADRLGDEVDRIARSLAEGGPEALALTKSLLAELSRQAVSVAETAKASAAPRLGAECRAGLAAFFDKRPVPWSPGPGR